MAMLSQFTFIDGNLFPVSFDFEGRIAVKMMVRKLPQYSLFGNSPFMKAKVVTLKYNYWCVSKVI